MANKISVTIRGDESKLVEVQRHITETAKPGTTVEVQLGEDVVIREAPDTEREWLEEYLRVEFA